jgi:hypothetical protein
MPPPTSKVQKSETKKQIEELRPILLPDCPENYFIALLYSLSLYNDNKFVHLGIFKSQIFNNIEKSNGQQSDNLSIFQNFCFHSVICQYTNPVFSVRIDQIKCHKHVLQEKGDGDQRCQSSGDCWRYAMCKGN